MEGYQELEAESEHNGVDEKLYVPRTLDGEVNERFGEILRSLENELSAYPWFLCLVPYGSLTKGYARKDSDIDVRVFCDENTYDNKASDDFTDVTEKVMKQYGTEIHYSVRAVGTKDLMFRFGRADLAYSAAGTLKDISKLAIGPKVDALRNQIRALLESATPELRATIFKQTLNEIMDEEAESGEKMTERMTYDSGVTDDIIRKRMELWEKRLEKLWGYKPE